MRYANQFDLRTVEVRATENTLCVFLWCCRKGLKN